MQDYFEIYLELNKLFKSRGFKLYIVGGYVRDFVFKKPIKDLDLATDATPNQMKSFLNDANYEFEDFGHVEITYKNILIDIDTFRRINGLYYKPRNPTSFLFVKDMSLDYLHRDFTINALYMDENKKIYDFCNGLSDIKNKVLKTINSNPDDTLKKDPINIIRALRFSLMYNLKIDEDLKISMLKNSYLLKNIDYNVYKDKLNQLLQIKNSRLDSILKEYNITRR